MIFELFNGKGYDLSHGFLPKEDPLGVGQLPSTCDAFEQLALDLPKWSMSSKFRTALASLPYLDVASVATDAQLERMMLILSFLGHAYVWDRHAEPADTLPPSFAQSWHAIAHKLGRPPVLSYASYALYNWRRLDTAQPIELDNIVLLQNFYGGIDEEWFILIHIDIEARAIGLLQALPRLQLAMEQSELSTVATELSIIATGISAMANTLARMGEHCDPYIYYNRVRPCIHGWHENPTLPDGLLYEGVAAYGGKRQFFKGETGAQSSIIPAIDCVLGVNHIDSPLARHLQSMRDYMPPGHRGWLEHLESKGTTVRSFIDSTDCGGAIVDNFAASLDQLVRFRDIHLKYAKSYIANQNQGRASNPTDIGTGGTPYIPYLSKHLTETAATKK